MTPEQYQRVQAAIDRQSADAAAGSGPSGAFASEGRLSDFLMGAGQYITERTPYVKEHTAGLIAPATTAASLGKAAPGVAIGAAAPGVGVGGMIAQGLLAAGQEYLRRGSTGEGVAMEGGLTGLATGAADVLTRGLSGAVRIAANTPMGQRVQAAIGRQAEPLIRSTSERLTRLAETWGGMGAINRAQQRAVTEAWVGAIGEQGPLLTRELRNTAATRIGAAMDAALPTGRVDVTPAYVLLDAIPGQQFPGKDRILQNVAGAENNPRLYQQAMADIRDTARNLANEGSAWADEFIHGLDELGHAGELAGAANTRIEREQYKNLMLVESIPTVRRSFQVPVLSAEAAVFKRYNPGTLRRAGQGTLPATQHAIEMTQAGAEEAAARFKSSGSAERGTESAAAMEALGAVASPTPAQSILRALGPLVGSPLLGAASVGARSDIAGQAGAAAGRETYRSLVGEPEP